MLGGNRDNGPNVKKSQNFEGMPSLINNSREPYNRENSISPSLIAGTG